LIKPISYRKVRKASRNWYSTLSTSATPPSGKTIGGRSSSRMTGDHLMVRANVRHHGKKSVGHEWILETGATAHMTHLWMLGWAKTNWEGSCPSQFCVWELLQLGQGK